MRKWYGLRVARHTGMLSGGIGRAHNDLLLRTPSRNINTFAIRYYSELLMERSCPLDLIVPKRTRAGIPSKRRPFSCIHAINTNPLLLSLLLPLTILSFSQKGSHSSPPSFPPTCLCTLTFSLTGSKGQKEGEGTDDGCRAAGQRKCLPRPPPSNSSSLTSEGFSSTVTCLWSSTPRGGALSELRFAESLLLILCKATKRS